MQYLKSSFSRERQCAIVSALKVDGQNLHQDNSKRPKIHISLFLDGATINSSMEVVGRQIAHGPST
jgi:hypothetical protein